MNNKLIAAIFLLLFIVTIITINSVNKIDIKLDPTNPWVEEKTKVSTYNGVPLDILERLIESESSWNINAINKNDRETSVGLAQINLHWIDYYKQKYNITDPYKPSDAINFASRYLKDLYDRTGSWYEAVLAYKCGYNGRSRAPEKIKNISYWVVYGKERPEKK